MARAFSIIVFAMERVRTVLLALSLIVMVKTAWLVLGPAVGFGVNS